MTNFDVYLADAKTVAIAGHVRPDGDCAGSCLATYNYIKNYFPHVKVDLYLEPIPNIFKFMKRSEEILTAVMQSVLAMLQSILNRQNIRSVWIIM